MASPRLHRSSDPRCSGLLYLHSCSDYSGISAATILALLPHALTRNRRRLSGGRICKSLLSTRACFSDGCQVLSVGQTYVSYKNLTTWGWNKHLWDVPFVDHEDVRLGAWLLEFFFLLGMACTKISILFVYRRISNGSHSRWFIRLIWAAIAFTVAYAVALTLYLFLICHPWDSYWRG